MRVSVRVRLSIFTAFHSEALVLDEENDVDEAVESGRLTSEGDIEDTEADMDISDSVISVLLPSETTDGASDTALMLDDILRGAPVVVLHV